MPSLNTPSESNAPLGKSEKLNVALQRPSVNIKESENQGEQAASLTQRIKKSAGIDSGLQFSRHGTFGPPKKHPIEEMFED